MKLTKKDILSIPHIQASDFDTPASLDVTGVSIDSRTVKPGELFVAIRGDQFDGHINNLQCKLYTPSIR